MLQFELRSSAILSDLKEKWAAESEDLKLYWESEQRSQIVKMNEEPKIKKQGTKILLAA